MCEARAGELLLHNAPKPTDLMARWIIYDIKHAKISLTVIVYMLHVKYIRFSWSNAELINLLGTESGGESCIQGSPRNEV